MHCNQCSRTVVGARFLSAFFLFLGTCDNCGVTSCRPDSETASSIKTQVENAVANRKARQQQVKEKKENG